MFDTSEDDVYSGYGLEQHSLVYTVNEHKPLAASDVREWLMALGKALQKRRLIEKANTWARLAADTNFTPRHSCSFSHQLRWAYCCLLRLSCFFVLSFVVLQLSVELCPVCEQKQQPA